MSPDTVLISFCGKMAAGKSTLAKALAEQRDAVLLSQDEFLSALYPGEILTVADYSRCYARLKAALSPTIQILLRKGNSVVLDFPANTRSQRAWFRELFETAQIHHELHFLEVSNEVCKNQLRKRSKGLPLGSPWTTEAEFDAISAYFEPPAFEEGFNVIHHARA